MLSCKGVRHRPTNGISHSQHRWKQCGLRRWDCAFTSVSADRTATVEVAEEDTAYLAIFPSDGQPNGTFANQDTGPGAGEEIALDVNDAPSTTGSSEGVGADSVYIFDDVFRVENGGTQDIYLDLSPLIDVPLQNGSGDVTLEFFAKNGSGNRVVIDGSTAELTVPVGGQRPVGVRIRTDAGSTYSAVSGPIDTDQTQGETTTLVADTTIDSGTAIDPGTPGTILTPP